MQDIRNQVIHCFGLVFPDIAPDEIPRCSTSSVATWDSVAQVTLLSALSEEFNIDFDPQDYEELLSFAEIVAFVEHRLTGANG